MPCMFCTLTPQPLLRRQDWLDKHKKEIIAKAVHGAGGKIEELMKNNNDEEWFDFANEVEEVSDDDWSRAGRKANRLDRDSRFVRECNSTYRFDRKPEEMESMILYLMYISTIRQATVN